MDRTDKIIIGTLAAVGLATYLFSTKKGKKKVKSLSSVTKDLAEKAQEKIEEKHTEIRESLANKIFDYAVTHKDEISNVAATVAPFLLKSFVKRKF